MVPVADQLVDRQAGGVSRGQCLAYGVSRDAVAWRLQRGHWRALHEGVYVTYTGGRVEARSACWAAVLAAGEGAATSHETAAWLWGFARFTLPLRVAVPNGRRLAPLAGVTVVRSRRVDAPALHAPSGLRCTSPHDTVLDLVDEAGDIDRVLSVIADAVQKRATTARRLQLLTCYDPSEVPRQ